MMCSNNVSAFKGKLFLCRIITVLASAGTFAHNVYVYFQTVLPEFLYYFFKIFAYQNHTVQIVRSEFIKHFRLLGYGIDRRSAFYHSHIVGRFASVIWYLILVQFIDHLRKLCKSIFIPKIEIRMATFCFDFYPVACRTNCTAADLINISIKRNHLCQTVAISFNQCSGPFQVAQSLFTGIGCQNQISFGFRLMYGKIFCHHQ